MKPVHHQLITTSLALLLCACGNRSAPPSFDAVPAQVDANVVDVNRDLRPAPPDLRPDRPRQAPDLPSPDAPRPDLPPPDAGPQAFDLSVCPQPDQGVPPPAEWALAAGGPGLDGVTDLIVDKAGNIYITGLFSGKATFGALTATSKGKEDTFIAKLDPAGNYQWLVTAGSTDVDRGVGLALASTGGLYVMGWYYTALTLGGTTLPATNSLRFWIAYLDPCTGKVLWVRSAGPASSGAGVWVNCIDVDPAGNAYLVGMYLGTVTFGKTTLTSASTSDHRLLVSKVSPTGAFLWTKTTGWAPPHDTRGAGCAVDSSGNVYATGEMYSSSVFGKTVLKPVAKNDGFVAKFNTAGAPLWALGIGSVGKDWTTTVAVTPSGDPIIAGRLDGAASLGGTTLGKGTYFARLTSTGAYQWAVGATSPSLLSPISVTVESSGTIAAALYFSQTATLGKTVLTSKGGLDILVTRLSPKGAFLASIAAGGPHNSDGPNAIAAGPAGELYVGGGFSQTASFGKTTLTSSGNIEAFTWKVKLP